MSCSPELVDYLRGSWAVSKGEASIALTKFLLRANDEVFQDQEKYPSRAAMDHIIRSLLPPKDVVDHDGHAPQQFWDIFCEKVVPNLTKFCEHEDAQCRTVLVGMIFEIFIDVGVLDSYERKAHLTICKVLFQSLLDRGDNLKCSWIASSVQKVIEADSLFLQRTNEVVSIKLLSKAVQQSNNDLVSRLLDHGVDIHTAHGRLSHVEQACYTSDLTMFNLIIGQLDKMLVNNTGSQGKTLLHWAVSGTVPGYFEKIEQLLELGANIDSEVDDTNADTALTLASRTYREDIVTLLVSKGANALHRGRDGWSVLHASAFTGDLGYIRTLLPSDVPKSFWMGFCRFPVIRHNGKPCITENTAAIHLAAYSGRSSFIRFMIQTHIPLDINAVTGYPLLTPLHLACLWGHLDIVEILIASKANVNTRDAYGCLPVDYAARDGNLEIFTTLLKSGSDNPSGRFAVSIARLMSKRTGCRENVEDSKAMSRFHFEQAIVRGNLDWCKELAELGQSISAELLTQSYTPLVCAVVNGQSGIVDWLVSAGVEVTNPVIETLHPSLRCIVTLTTHHIPSTKSLFGVMRLALKHNLSWYGGILGPLHVAILDNKMEALDMILKHIRENDYAYRKMIETELISLPADFIAWRGRSALSILVNEFNHPGALSNDAPWALNMPSGSPLHWSIRTNNVPAMKLLLRNEAEVNQVDSSGSTPLLLAVSNRHPAQMIRRLLNAGAGLAEPSRCRIASMKMGIRTGNLEVVKILAEADPETLKGVDQHSGDILLHVAGSAGVFQYLVSRGADPFNVQEYRSTAVTGNIRPMSLLRGFIFNSGLVSESAEDPLACEVAAAAFASDPGDTRLIKNLYRSLSTGVFGKLVNSPKYGRNSLLCMAASTNSIHMVEDLVAMSAEIDFEGSRYGSALMAACVWGCLDVVRCLVRSGALLCYVNGDGLPRSAVNLSVRHQSVTRWLLVDRHVEQRKLEHHSSQHKSQHPVWGGPRLFKLALPAHMHRDFGESRWNHVQRLQKWKRRLLGSTLAESRRNSGLDFKADLEVELRKSEAQAARRQFFARLGEE